jgi:hypothetical protein
MALFLERIDSAPLADDDFSFTFNSWISNLVDTLNEVIVDVQDQFNSGGDGLVVSPKTMSQIALLAVDAQDGTMWYAIDHVPPVFVGKVNGALVQFLTAPYP